MCSSLQPPILLNLVLNYSCEMSISAEIASGSCQSTCKDEQTEAASVEHLVLFGLGLRVFDFLECHGEPPKQGAYHSPNFSSSYPNCSPTKLVAASRTPSHVLAPNFHVSYCKTTTSPRARMFEDVRGSSSFRYILVAPQGFEPRLIGSEPTVLPLNEGAKAGMVPLRVAKDGSLTAF